MYSAPACGLVATQIPSQDRTAVQAAKSERELHSGAQLHAYLRLAGARLPGEFCDAVRAQSAAEERVERRAAER